MSYDNLDSLGASLYIPAACPGDLLKAVVLDHKVYANETNETLSHLRLRSERQWVWCNKTLGIATRLVEGGDRGGGPPWGLRNYFRSTITCSSAEVMKTPTLGRQYTSMDVLLGVQRLSYSLRCWDGVACRSNHRATIVTRISKVLSP